MESVQRSTLAARMVALLTVGVAVLALAGATASIASAANGTLSTTTGGPVHLHAEQVGVNLFTFTDHPIGGGFASKTCKVVKMTSRVGAPAAAGSSTFTAHPTYEGCTAFGLASVIDTSACDYVIHTKETVGGTGSFDGSADIVCEAGGSIKITALTCELKLDPQTGINTITATNTGGSGTGMDLLLHVSFTGISYTVTKDGIGCPLAGTGSFTKGDYTGSITVSGTNPETGAQVGITLDD